MEINTQLAAVNIDLLHEEVKASVSAFQGVVLDRDGIRLAMKDDASQADIDAATRIAGLHNPAMLTTEQQERVQGTANVDDLLGKINKALTDLGAKQATFQAAPTLANAAPLLVEISQDLTGVLKALKHVLKNTR
ncbi:MAG: hypothetical protein LCI00_16800 [Chloroflexi bacterium]|nr:hypothetical protein [Chloroflexota bacterium]